MATAQEIGLMRLPGIPPCVIVPGINNHNRIKAEDMPYRARGMDGAELLDWLRNRCTVTEDGHWLWNGRVNEKGYGTTNYQRKAIRVHQLSWMLANGPVPEGKELDHTCRIRRCCAPTHLEPVTHLENVLRGDLHRVSALRYAEHTHCPEGHEYTKENTYADPSGNRRCRICKREKQRIWRAMKRNSTMEDYAPAEGVESEGGEP